MSVSTLNGKQNAPFLVQILDILKNKKEKMVFIHQVFALSLATCEKLSFLKKKKKERIKFLPDIFSVPNL